MNNSFYNNIHGTELNLKQNTQIVMNFILQTLKVFRAMLKKN